MNRMKTALALLLLVVTATAAGAQRDSLARADSVLDRARRLAAQGRETDARRLVDSVLRANTPESRVYSEALYTRGALAPSAAEAERDYRRLLIEAPLAPRAEDAMLQLANLLQARGDRRGASDYFQRFLLTYANSPARPRVAVSLVRLLFDQGPQQQARACEALRQGRDAVPAEHLELRNQLEFYAPRCVTELAAMPVTPAGDTGRPAREPDSARAAAPVVAAPVTVAEPTAQASPTAGAAGKGTSFYSVQVAAYDSEEAALRLAKILVDRGIEARVDGATRPYRVRIGRYDTRADAVKALTALKAQGHAGFVTMVQER